MLGQSTNRRVGSIILAALLIMSAVATPVAANHDDDGGPVDEILDTAGNNADDNATFGLSTAKKAISSVQKTAGVAWGFAQGVSDRADHALQRIRGTDTTAATAADDIQTYYNANNRSFEDYANSRTDASTDYDVFEIRVTVDGETETRYLVATVENDSYVDSEIVTDTSRDVDHCVELEGIAAESASDDLEEFHKEFVTEDENITSTYKSRLTAKYAGSVSGSLDFLPEGDD